MVLGRIPAESGIWSINNRWRRTDAFSVEIVGRGDVVAAMARHDAESRTNFGSIHPTVAEELEKADWEGGLRRMIDQESAGFKDLERIFGPIRPRA